MPTHGPLILTFAVVLSASHSLYAQEGKVFRCVIDGRTAFQNTPCPPLPVPQAPNANKSGRPDPEAMRAEQARQRAEFQKGFTPQAPVQATKRQEPTPTSPDSSVSQCFSRGDAIAKVYLANIKQAIEVGMLASEMMEKGCMQSVGGQGASCVADCRAGFKAEAKLWVRGR